jgi:hypothetical protein
MANLFILGAITTIIHAREIILTARQFRAALLGVIIWQVVKPR